MYSFFAEMVKSVKIKASSISECTLFCGNLSNISYPDWKTLSWVVTADHLGHTLHQSDRMDHDCKVHRAQFIKMSIKREASN